ncbi:unnamed protein product [Closterium sp. Naga37s-1]|nr:unnamed protein product [Closterium sp. Naga37s-1]CAI5528848.1 unnamed protein product [Closterium sp. Naga37s-1]
MGGSACPDPTRPDPGAWVARPGRVGSGRAGLVAHLYAPSPTARPWPADPAPTARPLPARPPTQGQWHAPSIPAHGRGSPAQRRAPSSPACARPAEPGPAARPLLALLPTAARARPGGTPPPRPLARGRRSPARRRAPTPPARTRPPKPDPAARSPPPPLALLPAAGGARPGGAPLHRPPASSTFARPWPPKPGRRRPPFPNSPSVQYQTLIPSTMLRCLQRPGRDDSFDMIYVPDYA